MRSGRPTPSMPPVRSPARVKDRGLGPGPGLGLGLAGGRATYEATHLFEGVEKVQLHLSPTEVQVSAPPVLTRSLLPPSHTTGASKKRRGQKKKSNKRTVRRLSDGSAAPECRDPLMERLGAIIDQVPTNSSS